MTALCQNSKIKYFGRLFLAFVMLLGGVFFTSTFASAEIITDFYTIDGGTINISTSTENSIMFCSIGWDDNLSFSVDNATSTNILNTTYTDAGSYISIAYLKNPKSGNSLFSFSSNPRGDFKCFLATNVDTTQNPVITFINSYNLWVSSMNLTINRENINDYYLLYNGNFYDNSNNLTNASSTSVFSSIVSNANVKTELFLVEKNSEFPINQIFNFNKSGGATFWYLDLPTISEPPTPPSNDYVMYYGANPVYTPVNSNYNLPVVYNVCDSWSAGDIILKLNNDNASSSEKLLTQCSGTINFNSGAGSSEMSNTSYFTIENFRDDTILATSGSFISTVYTPLNASDGFIVWNFPAYQYFDYTKTATTSLAFQYNVCSDTNYSTSSKICIRNTSHPTNDPSNYCMNLETCSGTGNIELPVFSQENSLTLNFSYYDGNGDFQLASNQFSIVYYNGTYDTRAKWLVQAGDIACTPEEWESTNVFMNIKCGVMTGGVAIAQMLGDSASAGVRILIGMLDGVFPFNLPIKIKQCWDDSETKLLPSELNKINILDESGNVKINLPSEWAESGSITIWGSDVWNSTNESNEFFVFIRNLTKYLIWGIFILTFYLWGKSLIEK